MAQQPGTIDPNEAVTGIICSIFTSEQGFSAPKNTDNRLKALEANEAKDRAERQLLSKSKEAWIAYRIAVELGSIQPDDFSKLSDDQVASIVLRTKAIRNPSSTGITTLTSRVFERAARGRVRSKKYNSIIGHPVNENLPPPRKRKRGLPGTPEFPTSPSPTITTLTFEPSTMRETDILVERGSVNDAPSQTSGRANVEPASSNGSQGPNSNLTHGNDMRGGCDTVGQYVALDWEVFEGCLYTWPPAQYLQHVFDPRTCREIVQKEGAASVGFQWTDQATESRFSFHLRDKADSNLAYELYGVHIDIIDAGQSTCYRTISHNDGSVGKIPKGSRYCLSQAMVRPIQTRLGDVVGQAVKRSTRRGQEDRAGRALTDCIILNVYGDSSRFTRVDVIVDFIDVFGIAARFWPAQV